MSKTRLVSSLAAALGMLAAACWLVTATFPLAGAPQILSDAPGVTVDLGGATLMHRTAIDYPATAREKGIQGALLVQVRLDGNGNVSDAQVLSGPEELRNPALSAVLNWHFTRDSANSVRQLTVNFQAGAANQTRLGVGRPVPPPPPLPGDSGQVLKSVNVEGLSDQAHADLLARLPLHEGDTVTSAQIAQATQAVREFDEHLVYSFKLQPGGGIALNIRLPDAGGRGNAQAFRVVPVPSSEPAAASIRVGGDAQSTKLISQTRPMYPPLAKQGRIQGVVKLVANIAPNGTVQDLTVISGHPLLVPAALDAVKQWVYSPTLLNGAPVAVQTEVDVNFTLAQ